MDQQQEQREGKGGVRERGEELQKKREQSWRRAGGGSGAPGRSDWDNRAAQINSSWSASSRCRCVGWTGHLSLSEWQSCRPFLKKVAPGSPPHPHLPATIQPLITSQQHQEKCRSLQSDRKMPGGLNISSDSPELRAAGIIVPIIFSLIFLVGTVGNGLVLAVLLWNGQVKHSTTNLFILNLAVADLCFIICCVPFQATIYTLDGWLFGAFACKAVHFLIYLTMYASSFTLAAVSVDRYLAIRYPLKSRDLRTSRNAGVAIVVIWSLSMLFAGPYLSYYQIIHYHGVPICVPIWEDQRRKVLDMLTFVFGYLLPVTVVSLAYSRTIKFLWTSVDPIERISESRKAKRKVTKMIVTVAILFCLCWLPHHLVILCFWFGHFPFNRATYAFRLASHCLSYTNSCLNPIVYALISKHFRKRFKQAFTCLFFQNKIRKKKKKRIGRKVHMVNVEGGFANRTGDFCGGNTEVTQAPEENTRKRDHEGASRARAWTQQVQDAMVSVQKELLEEEVLATAGHSLDVTPLRGTVGQDQEEALEKG